MADLEGQDTVQMAAVERQLLLEMTLPEPTDDTPTVRLPVVCERSDEVADAPRAKAPSAAEMRVNHALSWGAWGVLLMAPAFTLSC